MEAAYCNTQLPRFEALLRLAPVVLRDFCMAPESEDLAATLPLSQSQMQMVQGGGTANPDAPKPMSLLEKLRAAAWVRSCWRTTVSSGGAWR